ncbi:MAG: transcriptional regulator, LuxR family, partial [Myxococcaceae bacterium]|nr:transcriptional regulator, LuxR family [Myxococcaceae bacterium]
REDSQVATSYLAHPPLVGRCAELAALDASLRGVMAGRGSATVIEALHGMGRTALVDHTELRAQLLGATALRVDGGAHTGSLAVARALVRSALRADPRAAEELRSRHPRATAICLQDGPTRPVEGQHDMIIPAPSAERQAALATEILACLLALSRLNPLVVLVDDAQRADSESLGLLASLARDADQHALGIVITVAIDESPREPGLLSIYAKRASHIGLGALTIEDTSELVATLFGGVPNCLRMALWLHGETQGRPLHTMALAGLLLSRGVVRYASGMFSLPHDVSDDFGEVDLGRALLARFDTMSSSARMVARLLSIHEQVVTVRELLESVELDETDTRRALAELQRCGILSVSEEQVSFVHRALRSTIESSLGTELCNSLHRRAARTILSHTPLSRERQVQAGLHLLRAGEEDQGAELLADAAIALAYTTDGSSKIIQPLEAALVVFQKQGRSDKACIRILTTLTVAGFYGDPTLMARYFRRTYQALLELSGTRLAAALGSVLGRRLALVVGLVYAWLTYSFTPRKQRLPSFGEVLTGLFGVAVAGAGAMAAAYDAENTIAVAEALEPFSSVGRRSAATAARDMCVALSELMKGLHAGSVARLAELSTRLVRGGTVRRLNDEVRQQMLLGCVYLMGINEVCTGSADALLAATMLEREPRESSKPRAELLRMCHYGFRGEQDLADAHRLAAERLSLLGGNSRSALTAMAVRSLVIAQWTNDNVALLRVMEELDRATEFAPTIRDYCNVAEAYLAFSRGQTELAIELHERLLRSPRRFPLDVWALQRAHYAHVLSSLGRHEQAHRICSDGLLLVQPNNQRFRFLLQPLTHELALAEARLGDTRSAIRRLGALMEDAKELDNPLLLGSLHRDRARVALIARDRLGFDRHLAAMSELFRATRNPCLIQQCDGLAAQAVTTGVHPVPAAFREARTRTISGRHESISSTTVLEPNKYTEPS